MAKNFRELEAKMSPESRARTSAMAKEAMAEMLLVELCKISGQPQEELADLLGIKSPSQARIEEQPDEMSIGMLQRLVETVGGKLEIVVNLPSGEVCVKQLDDAA